jgi:hypothetical protein
MTEPMALFEDLETAGVAELLELDADRSFEQVEIVLYVGATGRTISSGATT